MKLRISEIFDWDQLVPGHYRGTFHFAQFMVQEDRMMGAVDMTIALLGVGFRVRFTYTETEFARQMEDELNRINVDDLFGDHK